MTAAGPRLWHQLVGNILMAAAGIVCTLGALALGAWVWWHLGGPETRWQLFGAYATGSGFVIDKEGYILTNNHVISMAANDRSATEGSGDSPIVRNTNSPACSTAADSISARPPGKW